MAADGGIPDAADVNGQLGPATGQLTALYWTGHDGPARATSLDFG